MIVVVVSVAMANVALEIKEKRMNIILFFFFNVLYAQQTPQNV
jgi:hypothetical protein